MDINRDENFDSHDRDQRKRRDRSRDRHIDRNNEKHVDRNRDRNRDRSHDRNRNGEKHRDRSRDRRRSRRDRSRSPLQEKISQRKPNKFWDVPPVGFEEVPVMEYKAMLESGQVPQPPVSITGPAVLSTNIPFVGNAVSRQARRLYVGNIPFGIQEDEMKVNFNQQMSVAGLSQGGGDSVIACQINPEKNFAFLEFRSVDECTQAMAFDGLLFNGQVLKIRRPRDYQPLAGISENPSICVSGVVSTQVNDTFEKLYIGNLAQILTEENVKELLTSFGVLKAFNLVMEVGSGLSKGYAFCEYMDPASTEAAILGLHGFPICSKNLIVQRASVGKNPLAYGAMLTNIQIPGLNPEDMKSSNNQAPSQVLCLVNMLTEEDLENDEEYEEVMEDVKDECSKFGRVVSLEIPRPIEGVEVCGVGKIFVEFSTPEDAQKAEKSISGRKFNNKMVVTSYFDYDKYHNRDF